MTISISQQKYLKEIIAQQGLSTANPTKLPMAAGTQLECYDGDPIDGHYATCIGELLYVALGT